jgi:hypothetical protein
MEEVFPYKDNIDHTLLRTTEEGLYSVTKRKDSEKITSIISQFVGDSQIKSITDATACIGGDTIQFGLHFKTVHSIEINQNNLEVLRHNLDVYDLTNVTVHEGDAVKIFNWHTDVLYIDPPWGGPDYRQTVNLDIAISNTRLDKWLEEILMKKFRPSFIFLKLPRNYNFKRFNFLPNTEHIRAFHVRNYILVSIRVHAYSSVKTDL